MFKKEDLMSKAIIWQDPPKRRRRTQTWDQRLKRLEKQPGRWARLSVHASGQAAGQTAVALRKRPTVRGRFEIVSRTTTSGRGAIYGRYIGS
jgi:hypothetical protein